MKVVPGLAVYRQVEQFGCTKPRCPPKRLHTADFAAKKVRLGAVDRWLLESRWKI